MPPLLWRPHCQSSASHRLVSETAAPLAPLKVPLCCHSCGGPIVQVVRATGSYQKSQTPAPFPSRSLYAATAVAAPLPKYYEPPARTKSHKRQLLFPQGLSMPPLLWRPHCPSSASHWLVQNSTNTIPFSLKVSLCCHTCGGPIVQVVRATGSYKIPQTPPPFPSRSLYAATPVAAPLPKYYEPPARIRNRRAPRSPQGPSMLPLLWRPHCPSSASHRLVPKVRQPKTTSCSSRLINECGCPLKAKA